MFAESFPHFSENHGRSVLAFLLEVNKRECNPYYYLWPSQATVDSRVEE